MGSRVMTTEGGPQGWDNKRGFDKLLRRSSKKGLSKSKVEKNFSNAKKIEFKCIVNLQISLIDVYLMTSVSETSENS